MLKSAHRLSIPLFKKVIDKGKVFHSSLFVIRIIKSQGQSRFSVAVSKKVAKSAVERNKIRRRAYSILHNMYLSIQPGFHGVFMAKQTILKSSIDELNLSIKEAFVKIGILK